MKQLFFAIPLLLALGACQEQAASTAPSATPKPTAKPSATAAAATATATAAPEPKKALSKLPGKLGKPLGKCTPEDIKKACEANGLKCELKKWDKTATETWDKYNVSFGDSGLWVNIWIDIGAPDATVKMKTAAGGRPASNDGKVTISIDASDKEARHDEGQRVLDALLAK